MGFYLVGSVCVKVSCIPMGFVGRVVRFRGESIDFFSRLPSVRKIFTPVKWNVSL